MVCVDKLEETKILGGICFDDFLIILDNIEEVSNNYNNIAINNYPGITVNIYRVGIKIEEAAKKYKNLTFIDLTECGEELKKFYNLSNNTNLYLISIDIYNKESNKVTNDFNFEIYLKNGTQLEDLSACKTVSLEASSSLTKLDLAKYYDAKYFYSQGYNIYNISSEFYHDYCLGAYFNNNDIIIKDRIKYIYPYNISLCPNGCKLNNVEIDSKRVNCSCNISLFNKNNNNNNLEINKSNINLSNSKNSDNLFCYLLDNINYKIFKCYKELFASDINDLIKNFGIILGIIFIIINCICLSIFYLRFLPQIRIQIFKTIQNNKIKRQRKNENKIHFNICNKKNNDKYLRAKNKSKYIIESQNKNKQEIKLIKFKNHKKINSNKSSNCEHFKSKSYIKHLNNQKKDYSIYDEEMEEEYNNLPFTKALMLDKRNIIKIYISLVKMKFEITSLIFPEPFTHRSLTLSILCLNFLFNYFVNALVYNDEIISQKYHNNGKLDLIISIILSLISNIISSIFNWAIKNLVSFNEYFIRLVEDIKMENEIILIFQKLYKLLKIKIGIYFIINYLVSINISFYISIFCYIYQKTQISLLFNYLIGILQSVILSLVISFIATILRVIGLKCKKQNIYKTSVYINENI